MFNTLGCDVVWILQPLAKHLCCPGECWKRFCCFTAKDTSSVQHTLVYTQPKCNVIPLYQPGKLSEMSTASGLRMMLYCVMWWSYNKVHPAATLKQCLYCNTNLAAGTGGGDNTLCWIVRQLLTQVTLTHSLSTTKPILWGKTAISSSYFGTWDYRIHQCSIWIQDKWIYYYYKCKKNIKKSSKCDTIFSGHSTNKKYNVIFIGRERERLLYCDNLHGHSRSRK